MWQFIHCKRALFGSTGLCILDERVFCSTTVQQGTSPQRVKLLAPTNTLNVINPRIPNFEMHCAYSFVLWCTLRLFSRRQVVSDVATAPMNLSLLNLLRQSNRLLFLLCLVCGRAFAFVRISMSLRVIACHCVSLRVTAFKGSCLRGVQLMPLHVKCVQLAPFIRTGWPIRFLDRGVQLPVLVFDQYSCSFFQPASVL